MTQHSSAAPGSKTFVQGSVVSVMFNQAVEKQAGGTYQATVLVFMDTKGETQSQKWAQSYMDQPHNMDLKNKLIELQATPGGPITIHKTKGDQYWQVDRIDTGHVDGVRTTNPSNAGGSPGRSFDDSKMRSKDQCMRGEALAAAATLLSARASITSDVTAIKKDTLFNLADGLLSYIADGHNSVKTNEGLTPQQPAQVQTPVQQVVQQVVEQPVIEQPTQPVQQPAPVQQVVATPEEFDDGFGD